jgi:hypothetical protein
MTIRFRLQEFQSLSYWFLEYLASLYELTGYIKLNVFEDMLKSRKFEKKAVTACFSVLYQNSF